MTALLKQPLLHFLALGALLFGLHGVLNRGGEVEPQHILVDDSALVEYLQYRGRVFDPDGARRELAAMSQLQRKHLESQLIREEVLYREALALGLDGDDYVIRQRLVQKMEYLLRGFEGAAPPDPDALEAYYQRHRARYLVPTAVTFTHVHVRGLDDADHQRALALLDRLNAEGVSHSDAIALGDRFPYHTSYVDRDLALVASHFGTEFANDIDAMAPDRQRWQGPLASPHGYHLVLLSDRREAAIPPLAAIAPQVAGDMGREQVQASTDAAVQALVDRYQVDVRRGDISAASETK